MRDILFRGKRIDINEWIEGYYAVSPTDNKSYIYAKDYHEMDIAEDGLHVAYRLMQVIPETVGQFTGLTANGKKIFEGDIVRETITSYYQPIGKICYNAENCQWGIEYVNNIVSFSSIGSGRSYELLGNIYDTPMLLENAEGDDSN